ncbi:MAG TPA: Sjogren's syndrome/scleroderma autoantigen 1 family protein [Nitrososphaeraceae archaeon]
MSTGKYSDENEQEKGRNNIKGAADLLLKGGTLLSTSCAKCGGVQVRYKEETVCVSCGRKIKDANNGTQQIEVEELQHRNQHSIQDSNLSNVSKNPTVFDSSISKTTNTKIIIEKINFLISTLENENDLLIQNTKLDLISKYLEVIDKLKIINSMKEN